jgi:hypothetical protein
VLIDLPGRDAQNVGMTGDERDRILGLLSAGPATVARLAAGLGLPGGVVSYQLKLLDRQGLARVGTMRGDDGATTEVWVNTAAAAPPPLRIPAPLPGLTWTGDGPYPIPLWTAPDPAYPSPAADGTAHGPAAGDPAASDPENADRAGGERSDTGASTRAAVLGRRPSEPAPARAVRPPQPRRPDQATAVQARSPRLFDVRRVPVDDATFYEFARRLDALAREFAARATPGAPLTELTIGLSRPAADGTAGYGS